MSQKMTNFVIPIKDISIDMSSVNGVMLDFSGGPDSALLGYMLAGYKNKLNSDMEKVKENVRKHQIEMFRSF